MCAMRRKALFPSARAAFDLISRYALHVIALGRVTGFLFLAAKLTVTIGIGALAYWYFTNNATGLHFVGSPVFVIMVGTYLIAEAFFNVYSVAVDTLFLCFCMFLFYFLEFLY